MRLALLACALAAGTAACAPGGRMAVEAATPADRAPTAARSAHAGPSAAACPDDAGWNDPAAPIRVHGHTWYVGTCGITALLVTSPQGHVLLDAGTAKAAPLVLANIRALGFEPRDVRYIVNSHAHHDHAGGIAALRGATGATVVALDDAAALLRTGASDARDPQHGGLSAFAPIDAVRPIADGATLRVGALALTAHATPAHSPGGTTWTWRSCEAGHCLDIAYVDSLTAVAAPGYRFTDEPAPGAQARFRRVFERVAALPCDLLLTPHPQASALWSRLGPGADRALASPGACRAYADAAARRLDARLAEESRTP